VIAGKAGPIGGGGPGRKALGFNGSVTQTPREAARVLIVAAHPDDVDYSCAGATAGWVDAGVEVAYCVVTDGDAGGSDPSVPRSDVAALRREEQRKAGAAVGVTDIEFLGYPDGRLFVTYELRRDITRVIRRFRPDRVVLPLPVRNLRSMYASHPDHTAAGEAAMCAVYPDARNPFAHPELLAEEGLQPHAVGEVWVMVPSEPDLVLDITENFDRKMAALRAHASQGTHAPEVERLVRDWNAEVARAGGLAEGRLAEGFLVLDTR
jgi:LmbE family N-acetylglucosaminyl deacetylase